MKQETEDPDMKGTPNGPDKSKERVEYKKSEVPVKPQKPEKKASDVIADSPLAQPPQEDKMCIRDRDKDGSQIRIRMQKEKNLMVGKTYRFYFGKVERVEGKAAKIGELMYEVFYGAEEIPQEER